MNLNERQRKLLKRTFLDYQQTAEFFKNPLIVQRAEGLYYWDVEGKRYFDGIGGIFVATLGHKHPRLMAAMQQADGNVEFCAFDARDCGCHVDFIEKLGEVTPGNLNYIKPYSGGFGVDRVRMKFTRQYFKQSGQPGKYKFISRYFGYHGGDLWCYVC